MVSSSLSSSSTSSSFLNETVATEPPVEATPSPAEAQAMQAMLAFLLSRFHTLQLFLLAGYGIMFSLCVVLVLYLRMNRSSALRGDASAACKIILPAFEPLLLVLATATGIYTGFFCIALSVKLYTYQISKLATEVFYSGRQFVFLSVAVFMLQKSVSGPALRRSLFVTLLLATYSIPVAWFMSTYRPNSEFYPVITAVRAPLLLLYTYIFVRPPLRASKRTLREFCLFAYVYYAFLFAYNDFFHQDKLETGFVLTYCNLLWGSMCPLVIWRVLRADTQHWRGMGHRAVELQRLFQQNQRLPERVSSRGLHVLIEMHRKFIIDFAYLELKSRIGTGASAVVFNGLLRSATPVAVKVYTPMEFTDDIIAGFSQETALCGALHHSNIVQFYGMCICPPTICLVSELCQGSLDDVMCAIARRNSTHELADNRQQMLINIAYMLDAARSIEYMHSFRPAFLHRDIKPSNFLVDVEGTVKLTDFGESRPLPRTQVAGNGTGLKHTTSDAKLTRHQSNLSDFKDGDFGDIQVVVADLGPKMSIKGTVDYMAPEVINGRAGMATYGEAADVYSLGMTMWDILHPGQDKYPVANGNHFRVFELVTSGHRPQLEADIHPALGALMESTWQENARLRPTSQVVVSILETIQEEVCAGLAVDMMGELENVTVVSKENPSGIEHSLSGEQAVAQMQRLNYVRSVGEAVRMGNALMDAGLLHHQKHSRPFENSPAVYFFDDEHIDLCLPMAKPIPEPATSPRRSRHVSHHTSGTTVGRALSSRFRTNSSDSHSATLLADNGSCLCRKLGQRLAIPKAAMRRRLRGKRRLVGSERHNKQQQLQTRLLLASYDPMGADLDASDLEEFDLLPTPSPSG